MPSRYFSSSVSFLTLFCLTVPLYAQVDYQDKDSPWGQRADSGPDSEVPGWFYNLGITGLRAQLVKDQPKALLITGKAVPAKSI